MIMNIQKAVQRLHWRFSQNKPFKANTNDLSALNDIIKYVNQEEEKTRLNHTVLAKLFIKTYQNVLYQKKTDVFDQDTKLQFYKHVFEPTLEQLISEFTFEMNQTGLYHVLNEFFGETKHPLLRDAEEQAKMENDAARLSKEAMSNENVMNQLSLKEWDEQTVKECLMSELNYLINTYN